MPFVDGADLDRLHVATGQCSDWDWTDRRARGGATGGAADLPGIVVAHLALAWAHGDSAVALEKFEAVVAFGDSRLDITRRHVFAEADELFPVARLVSALGSFDFGEFRHRTEAGSSHADLFGIVDCRYEHTGSFTSHVQQR